MDCRAASDGNSPDRHRRRHRPGATWPQHHPHARSVVFRFSGRRHTRLSSSLSAEVRAAREPETPMPLHFRPTHPVATDRSSRLRGAFTFAASAIPEQHRTGPRRRPVAAEVFQLAEVSSGPTPRSEWLCGRLATWRHPRRAADRPAGLEPRLLGMGRLSGCRGAPPDGLIERVLQPVPPQQQRQTTPRHAIGFAVVARLTLTACTKAGSAQESQLTATVSVGSSAAHVTRPSTAVPRPRHPGRPPSLEELIGTWRPVRLLGEDTRGMRRINGNRPTVTFGEFALGLGWTAYDGCNWTSGRALLRQSGRFSTSHQTTTDRGCIGPPPTATSRTRRLWLGATRVELRRGRLYFYDAGQPLAAYVRRHPGL
jgi:hypothetical protein